MIRKINTDSEFYDTYLDHSNVVILGLAGCAACKDLIEYIDKATPESKNIHYTESRDHCETVGVSFVPAVLVFGEDDIIIHEGVEPKDFYSLIGGDN